MRLLPLLLCVCALGCGAARATDREFKDIVAAISEEFHARPVHIPLFGMVNVVAYLVRPAGTKHIDIAIFENLNSRGRLKTRDSKDPDLAQEIRGAVGNAWKPFVQVWSRGKGHNETVLVYMKSEGRDCKLLVTSVEPNEATVVEIKLNPAGLQRWLASPRESARDDSGRRD